MCAATCYISSISRLWRVWSLQYVEVMASEQMAWEKNDPVEAASSVGGTTMISERGRLHEMNTEQPWTSSSEEQLSLQSKAPPDTVVVRSLQKNFPPHINQHLQKLVGKKKKKNTISLICHCIACKFYCESVKPL